MHYVYVLWGSKAKEFYSGSTNNIKRRINEHKIGRCYTTTRMGDLEVMFYEAFKVKDDAERREKYFKTTKGKKMLRLILRESLKQEINKN